MKHTTLALGSIFVAGLFSWPTAVVLFEGPNVSGVELFGRAIALAIIALSYAVFVAALVYVSGRLPSIRAFHWKLLVICCLAIAGSLFAPFATLPPILLVNTVCTHPSFPCSAPEFLTFIPHALHVAATYPITQVFIGVPALLLLLWLAQNSFLTKASAHS